MMKMMTCNVILMALFLLTINNGKAFTINAIHYRTLSLQDKHKEKTPRKNDYDIGRGRIKPEVYANDSKQLKHRARISLRRSMSLSSSQSTNQMKEKNEHPKKKSKFSQLMSGERIRLSSPLPVPTSDSSKQKLNNINNSQEWSMRWEKNIDDEDCSISYSCVLPDDDLISVSDNINQKNTFFKSISSPTATLVPKLHNRREIHYAPSLLSDDQVSTILSYVKQLRQDQTNMGQEQEKSQCFVAIEDGILQDKDEAYCQTPDRGEHDCNRQNLLSLLNGIVEDQVLPIARKLCHSPNIVVADALIRWYGDNEDNKDTNKESDDLSTSFVEALAPHYDLSSYASMIIPLNPEECDGGLYIQYGAGSNTRHDVSSSFDNLKLNIDDREEQHQRKKMIRGDAILHRYDVMHGVQFKGGPRYSLVIWMAEDMDSCTSKTAPWIYKEAEEYMSVHAVFLRGMFAKYGLYGMPKSVDDALNYWEWAAERGHALSQYNLSLLLMTLDCSSSESEKKERIVSLMKSSALVGLDLAQHELGLMYKQGYFGMSIDHVKARKWFEAAACQGYARSHEILADKTRWL